MPQRFTYKEKPAHAIAAGAGKDVMKKYITKISSWFNTLSGLAATNEGTSYISI